MPSFHQQILEKEQTAEEQRAESILERRARDILSHLLPDENASVLFITCGDGALADMMADLWPHHNFTAIDKDKKQIRKARDLYADDNLSFMTSELGSSALKPGSFDIIIDLNFKLSALKTMGALLSKRGTLYAEYIDIRDNNQMAVIETADPALPEALKNFAHDDSPTAGFYLEERPPRIPRTYRYRLPLKWLQLFLAKQENPDFETEFSKSSLEESLATFPLRLRYNHQTSLPCSHSISFEDGTLHESPLAKTKIVIEKINEGDSKKIYEHRLTDNGKETITINAMRHEKTGIVHDILSKPEQRADIIPYYIAANGRLRVFIHDNAPRPIMNLVPRKHVTHTPWSGHMRETISVPQSALINSANDDHKALILFTRDYLGLKPAADAQLIDGPSLYPAPELSDSKVQTKFLKVDTEKNYFDPPKTTLAIEGYKNTGSIRSVDAEDLLNHAILGHAPTSKLDAQLIALFKKLEMPYRVSPIELNFDNHTPDKVLEDNPEISENYIRARGCTGAYENITSYFIEDGLDHASTQNFALPLKPDTNQYFTLPLTRNEKGEIFAAVCLLDTPNGTLLTPPKAETIKDPIKQKQFYEVALTPLSYDLGFDGKSISDDLSYIKLETLKDIALNKPVDYRLASLTLIACEALT